MKLPKIQARRGKARRELVSMGQINYSELVREGDLRQSVNLSERRYPYLTTRNGREKLSGYAGVTALAARDKLVAVSGTDLLYDGEVVGQVTAGEKQFAAVNTKLVIWPDKVYLDLTDKKVKPLEAELTLSARSVTFTENGLTADTRTKVAQGKDNKFFLGGNFVFKRRNGLTRTEEGWQFTSEEEVIFAAPKNNPDVPHIQLGDVLMLSYAQVSEDGGVFNLAFEDEGKFTIAEDYYAVVTDKGGDTYNGAAREIIFFDVYYCPLANADLTDYFAAGDAVEVTGAGENDRKGAVIGTVTETGLTFQAGDIITKTGLCEGEVTLARRVPEMDFICQRDNRLFGCSSKDQTIYASALGQPQNFFVYDGVYTDSYAVAVGTDGAFTGCGQLGSSVLFWKEDKLHKLLGNGPSDYSLYTYTVEGLRAGCHKSMRIINETLFYLGVHGVYTYTGGTPSLISANFGPLDFSKAVAGDDGERYYLSAVQADTEEGHLFVYDTRYGLWVREDGTRAVDFARMGRSLYCADGQGEVWLCDNGRDDGAVEWLAQFAPFYETVQGRKTYSKLLLRLELPRGSWLVAETRCDGGEWMECGKVVGREHDVIPLRLALNRCDKFELRLRGKGPCAVLSILREFSVGSEIR